MAVNKKKSIRLKNRTKYFNPDLSRTHVTFASPYSYQSRKIKIEGYETRLYWQYRYCEAHDGQTFFYTLTYNDAAMPKYAGINCFDYEDLRDLLTGGFRKYLLRHYGTSFRYFIGAELGDGKGERGLHNNPHYHVLFFLEPANNERYPYERISPEDFRHLVRKYWQGFDEDTDGYRDYNTAKYGIAREGENCGLVTDYRACCYCAKYVTKDVKLKKAEHKVEKYSRFRHMKSYKFTSKSYEDFFDEFIQSNYSIPADFSGKEYLYKWHELVRHLLGDKAFEFEDSIGIEPIEASKACDTMMIIKKLHLYEDYCKFCRAKVDVQVHDDLVTYRNRYCNKCRISQQVGDYALKFITDYMNPTVQIPSKKGFKNRPLPMYLYRKLYTDVISTDEVTRRGTIKHHSPIRVLNDLGVAYKVCRLDEQIKKKAEAAENDFNTLINDERLFERMRESDINIDVYQHYNDFQRMTNRLIENNSLKDIFKRYAEYKLIYEDRFLPVPCMGHFDDSDFPAIDIYDDYSRFIRPSIFTTTRSDLRLDTFLESDCPGYIPYSQHPYFLRYIGIFHILDMCADYWFIKGDDKAQKEAEDIAAVKRFHDREKLKEFYANFISH